ncbi:MULTISPECIES: hypothetical protein [unclassified Psychrobacter]|nr:MULTISPECIES: hypothetical protein [unclassified Psychrobacter]
MGDTTPTRLLKSGKYRLVGSPIGCLLSPIFGDSGASMGWV